jgi:hypothetical protein
MYARAIPNSSVAIEVPEATCLLTNSPSRHEPFSAARANDSAICSGFGSFACFADFGSMATDRLAPG